MARKFGVVGCQHGHIGAFIGEMLDLGWEFESIFDDGDDWLSAKLAEKHKVPVVADRGEYLARSKAEIVGCASVNRRKGADIAAALRAGRHVVADKPLAVTLEDLDLIERAHGDTGAQAIAMLTMRYSPLVRAMRSLVLSGAIGEVVGAMGLAPHRLSPPSRPRWMFDDELYGGVTVDIACHSVDIFLWLARREVEEVYCREWTTARHSKAHPGITDISTSIIRLEGGATGIFRPDWLTPDKDPNHGDYRFSVQGTRGRIECFLAGVPPAYGTPRAFLCSDDEPPREISPEKPGRGLIEEFVGYALEGKATSLTTEESIRSHRAVVLCRMSAKAGRPVRWEDRVS